jgi:hypothetical protein
MFVYNCTSLHLSFPFTNCLCPVSYHEHTGSLCPYMSCSESSQNLSIDHQCSGHIRCLSDLATLPLVMQTILYQIDWTFLYNWLCDQVCCCTVYYESVKEQRICVKLFRSKENSCKKAHVA